MELPEEAKSEGDHESDNVGLLQMSLYGTRDAAANFRAEVKKFMEGCGFCQGRYNASAYFHKKWRLRTMVHGDDFITAGGRDEVKKFRKELEERFEVKTKVVGTAEGEVREAKVIKGSSG